MSPVEQSLYFIAIVLPPPVSEEIRGFQQEIAVQYNSKKALRVVPHITLKAPFKLPAAEHEVLLKWFQSLRITISPFQQAIDGFGAFPNKRNPVIYVHPVMNSSLLQLQKEIIHACRQTPLKEWIHPFDAAYSPHITIAYRDLTLPFFQQAWQELETKIYRASFAVTGFHLLQHNGQAWQPVSESVLPVS